MQDIEQLLSSIEEVVFDEAPAPLEAHSISADDREDEADSEGPEAEPSEDRRTDDTDDLLDVSADDITSIYFHEMAREPLLSSEEEIFLAQQIERGHVAKEALASKELSAQERERLEKLVAAAEEAEARFIRANTRLVVSVAKRYASQGVPFLDLVQEGNLGLMRAVNKFDHRQGHRFSTYATWWIRQAIIQALADQGSTIRIPIHMGNRIRELHKVMQQMNKQLGRPPTEEEVAERMDIDLQQVRWMLRRPQHALSLEQPVDGEQDTELGHFIEDDKLPTPTDAAAQMLLTEEVNKVLATLDPREETILRLRYGLRDGWAYTLEEIGERFGLSRERIRQIEDRALRKLRHPVLSRALRDYQ